MLEILINDESLEVQAKPEHLSLYQLYLSFFHFHSRLFFYLPM